MPRKRDAHSFGPTHALFQPAGYEHWKRGKVEERAYPLPSYLEKQRAARKKEAERKHKGRPRYHPNDIRKVLRR